MIVIFLIVWLIPILIIAIAAYIDMEEGQSIEEYIKENKVQDPSCFILILLPVVNCFMTFCIIVATIYNKIKHFRKRTKSKKNNWYVNKHSLESD